MRQVIEHEWHLEPREAIAIQEKLRKRIRFEAVEPERFRLIAGVDVSYSKTHNKTIAGVVVYDRMDRVVRERTYAVCETGFPYVPGLLSFREGEAVCKALSSLNTEPDCVIFDGHGYAHPRRIGIATHIGILFDIHSCGCAKRRFVGEFDKSRDIALVYDRDASEVLSVAVRTKKNTNHIFISVGHRMVLPACFEIVLSCVDKHKLPEPTRLADLFVSQLRKDLDLSP